MTQKASSNPASDFSLNGQLLIAMPGIGDPRFDRAVVYLCSHSEDGAMGLVINRPADDIAFVDLLQQLNVIPGDRPVSFPAKARDIHVIHGGPVETSRGFVLHSVDHEKEYGSITINPEVQLSADINILHAIARGDGPDRVAFALGYAGWAAGQLEAEIQDNGWLLCPADGDLVFDEYFETKYERALASIGVDLAMLSGAAGRA